MSSGAKISLTWRPGVETIKHFLCQGSLLLDCNHVVFQLCEYLITGRNKHFFIRRVIVFTIIHSFIPFQLVESFHDGWRIRLSGVNNRKFVIDFQSSQVSQAHSCIRLVVKNALIPLPMLSLTPTQTFAEKNLTQRSSKIFFVQG